MKISDKQMRWIGVAVVTLVVLAVFAPVLRGGFLYWDDDGLYVRNPYYRGLTSTCWQWMCTTFWFGHWQPLTWLSCALDYTAWGLNPHVWHLTNWLLHAVNAVLVYLLCLSLLPTSPRRYVAATWAALFWAVHPLRVEVVAWLATRGYLLGTTFCLLTVLLYLQFRRDLLPISTKEDGRRGLRPSRTYYFAALLCFALATFTKGIGMMLPLVLLLMDWNLFKRVVSVRTAITCIIEKIPFFALSLLTGTMAFLAKKTGGGMMPVERYGILARFGQAVYGIWFYLLKIILPTNLSPLYYKIPEDGPMMVTLVLTATAAIFLFLFRRKCRPINTTLCAFLIMIFPMLGFTQSGSQLFADRFTYLSAVPFSILLAAGLIRLSMLRRVFYGALVVLLILFGVQSATWSVSWNSNLTLWSRAAAVDKNNAEAYNSIGLALLDLNQHEKALEYYERALQLKPGYVLAMHNRALALALLGRYDEAFAEWNVALAMPDIPAEVCGKILWLRGWVFEQTGNFEAAEKDYSTVADDEKCEPVQRGNILQLRAALYARTGRKEKALADLKTVLKLPDLFREQHQKAQAAMDEINERSAD